MRPLTRPASEFQVTWSLRLNLFAFERAGDARMGKHLFVATTGRKAALSKI
jgi:hypothetical protein